MKKMPIKGVDNATPVSEAAAKTLKENGVFFTGRYLVPPNGGLTWKALTKAEAERIRAAGLAILLCWELDAERARSGAAGGEKDGARARQLALDMGIPTSAAIYFAVDYCPQENEYDLVGDYIRAAAEAVAPYRCGVYGSYYVVEAMNRRDSCSCFWQCIGWSNGKLSEHAHVYQYAFSGAAESKAIAAKVGFGVDMDRCASMTDAGFWLPQSMKEYPTDDGGVIYDPTPDKPAARPWYADAMDWAASEGLIRDGRPNDYVTRAELATVLFRKFGPVDQKNDSGLLSDD